MDRVWKIVVCECISRDQSDKIERHVVFCSVKKTKKKSDKFLVYTLIFGFCSFSYVFLFSIPDR